MSGNNCCVFTGQIVKEPQFRLLAATTAAHSQGAFLQFELRVPAPRRSEVRIRCVAYHETALNLYPQLRPGRLVAVQAYYRKRRLGRDAAGRWHQIKAPAEQAEADQAWHWEHEFVVESVTFLSGPLAAVEPAAVGTESEIDDHEEEG